MKFVETRGSCVPCAHHGGILLISQVLLRPPVILLVGISSHFHFSQCKLQQSGFKGYFVLEYLMQKMKRPVLLLLKILQRLFSLLLRSQLVIQMRCHLNEDENMLHLSGMWN